MYVLNFVLDGCLNDKHKRRFSCNKLELNLSQENFVYIYGNCKTKTFYNTNQKSNNLMCGYKVTKLTLLPTVFLINPTFSNFVLLFST